MTSRVNEVGFMPRIIAVSASAVLGACALVAACSEPATPGNAAPAAKVAPAPAVAAVPARASPPADLPPAGQAINAATLSPGAAGPAGWSVSGVDPALVRAEVLLDRAGFSPGVIDGRNGENLRHAIAAYAAARGLASGGDLDQPVWDALAAADPGPAMQVYRITAADLAGPFIGTPPKDYRDLAKLPALAYSDPQQMLSERFHMDRKLLLALNPDADFTRPGTDILVAVPRPERKGMTVARIEIDKSAGVLRAYGPDDALVALYPASVGSTERPAPSGEFEVRAVAPEPAYYYDPSRLTFAPQGAKGKLKIAPGPNNPVGSTWIALTIETYGIHGSPDPALIGKRQSHGCVRLTNWDAAELGRMVKAGTKVAFVGTERPKA